MIQYSVIDFNKNHKPKDTSCTSQIEKMRRGQIEKYTDAQRNRETKLTDTAQDDKSKTSALT